MLCDWNAGTPQLNIAWTLQLGSEWLWFEEPVHRLFEHLVVVHPLWTENCATEDMLLPGSGC